MDKVLCDMKDKEVFVYIDDILIATESEERHVEVVSKVPSVDGSQSEAEATKICLHETPN